MNVGRTRSIGHPGKHGTLNQLLARMFQDVPYDLKLQLMTNLDTQVFGPRCYTDVMKHFKTQDIEVLSKLREFLGGDAESAKQANGSPYSSRASV